MSHATVSVQVPVERVDALIQSLRDLGEDPEVAYADLLDDPEYQLFLYELSKDCVCTNTYVCGGVTAGGFCDRMVEDDSEGESWSDFYLQDEEP